MFNVEMKSVGQELLDKGWIITVEGWPGNKYRATGKYDDTKEDTVCEASNPKEAINALASKIMERTKDED